MRRFVTFGTAVCLSVLLAATLATTSLAEKGGKPGGGGGGGDPPAAPINYEIQWFGNLDGSGFYASDINNKGQIVGSGWDETNTRVAYVLLPRDLDEDDVLDYANEMIVDINDMFVLDANGDATSEPTVPGGWRANRAESINEFDEVAGTLWDGANRAVYTIDLVTQTMVVIAENTGVNAKINDLGEIAYTKFVDGVELIHVYRPGQGSENLGIGPTLWGFNNAGQVTGSDESSWAFRYTPGDTPADDDILTIGQYYFDGDLNQSGSFTLGYTQSPRKRRAYRYSDANELQELGSAAGSPTGINNDGDVLIIKSGSSYVYTDQHGVLTLDDLVVGSIDDLADWLVSDSIDSSAINDRDGTGFGQIIGAATIDGVSVGFVLTPIPAPTP